MLAIVQFGASPLFEMPIPSHVPDWEEQCFQQCQNFIDLLRQRFGREPVGVLFHISSPPIAFPNYFEVDCWYDSEDFNCVRYVLHCKQYMPRTWQDTNPPFVPLN